MDAGQSLNKFTYNNNSATAGKKRKYDHDHFQKLLLDTFFFLIVKNEMFFTLKLKCNFAKFRIMLWYPVMDVDNFSFSVFEVGAVEIVFHS